MGQDRARGSGDEGSTARSLADVAGEWAGALVTTAYTPMSGPDIRDCLRDLTRRLVAALSGPSVDTHACSDVGARLVAEGLTGPQSLSRTVEVLVRGLPAATESVAAGPLDDRMIDLLGALVGGYTRALRDRIVDQQEEVTRALSIARQDVERDLQACEARFRQVFNTAAMGIAISEPTGRIVQTNPSLAEILGYRPGDLLGRDLRELFSPADRSTLEQQYQALLAGWDSRFRGRFRLRRADDEPAWVNLAASVLLDAQEEPEYLATMVDDITDLHLLEQRLNHQTLHDLQTALPNRQYFVTHLEKVLGRLEPSAVVTLLHLDLDGFSAINDGLGHSFGDRLLDVVARRLETVVADQRAMVARLGGDEYGILIEPGDSVPDVDALAELINTELAEPHYVDEIGMAVTATIGVVQRRVGGTQPDELLRAAGATLRRVRGKGKRQWTSFDPDIDATDRAHLKLAAAMPGALETGELLVAYQPVVGLDSRRLVGVEAALGWQHPHLGLLSNDRCVLAAEQTGAVHAVGQWLLHTAAEQAVSWRQRWGGGMPPVVVNLMPSQAQDPDLVARVRTVLGQSGVWPAELELRAPVDAVRTTSGLLAGEGGGHAEDNLRVLAELGVRVGLYDFGGGIGALRCLADLPVRTVRITQPISQQVADDPSRILSQAVHALIHIVRGAGVDVVAFPVDIEEQAACFRWVGANWGMGALYGQPGPPEALTRP